MSKQLITFLFAFLAFGPLLAQVDSTLTADSTQTKNVSGRSTDYKVYAGVTLSQITGLEANYESGEAAGFNLGVAIRKGRFAYWEAGLRYNGSIVLLDEVSQDQEESLGIRQVELPLEVGVNLLSAVRRFFGLRLYAGVRPGVIVGISDNELNFSKGDFNTFQLAGQAGLGVDIAFFFIEAEYSYGLVDLLKEERSRLSQGCLNVGFRF